MVLRTGPAGRHVLDVTLFFTPTSGGVRRYLLEKHRWLREHTRLKHTVLVPGAHAGGLPYEVMSFASPPIPFGGGYRLPLRMRALREQLARLSPDLLEVGDPYHIAWHALRVARERRVPAVAFCHSDIVRLARSILGTRAGRAAAREPELKETLGIPRRARLLVFAGRLTPEKRTSDLAAALRLLPSTYHLLVVGAARTGRRGDRLQFVEYQQDRRELARVLASCDAFVHAGDQETFGLVALEAMACGLPVVAARAGALAELVDRSVGETFIPRDPADLASAVTRLFERDLAEVRLAARRRAEARSWDSAFSIMLGRYTRLMGSTRCTWPRVIHAG
jgi:alpha-1,6-mannosyltransferase